MLDSKRIEERELIKGCLEENRAAQRSLYERYKRAMFTLSFRILNDYDLANDALQEAFIEVFRDIKNFRADSTLGAWIKIIVIRKSILRSKKNLRFESYESLGNEEIVDWKDNLTGEYLHNAVLQLPPGYRTIFTLIEVEGYSHKEVGNMLGISEGTSKSQLFHSKKILRKLLADFNNE